MEKEPHPKSEQRTRTGAEREEPPPFDPDPELVTYLEGGDKDEAKRRFRAEIEKRSAGRRK